MRVAIRQREAAKTLRIESREYLADAAAAVVTDHIGLVDVQRAEKFVEHFGICQNRHVLGRCDFRVPVREQIDRDRPAHIRQIGLLVTPKVAVHQHAMNKQRNRSGAFIGVADTP